MGKDLMKVKLIDITHSDPKHVNLLVMKPTEQAKPDEPIAPQWNPKDSEHWKKFLADTKKAKPGLPKQKIMEIYIKSYENPEIDELYEKQLQSLRTMINNLEVISSVPQASLKSKNPS